MDETTTPQGSTARGRTHRGGILMGGLSTQKSCPPVTRHRSSSHWSTRHRSPVNQSSSHQARIHQSTSHRSTRHHSTSHRSSSRQSLDMVYQALSTGHQSLVSGHQSTYQTPVSGIHAISSEYRATNQLVFGSEYSFAMSLRTQQQLQKEYYCHFIPILGTCSILVLL